MQHHLIFGEQAWQLGDVARYPSCLIERQPLRGFSIALVGVAVDVTEALAVCVENLEAAVQGFNGPLGGENGALRFTWIRLSRLLLCSETLESRPARPLK